MEGVWHAGAAGADAAGGAGRGSMRVGEAGPSAGMPWLVVEAKYLGLPSEVWDSRVLLLLAPSDKRLDWLVHGPTACTSKLKNIKHLKYYDFVIIDLINAAFKLVVKA